MADNIFDSLLIHTVSIKRRVEGSVNLLGVPSETFSILYTDVVCRIQDQKGTYILERKGEEVSVDSICFFKITQDIVEDDVVVFGSKEYSVYFVENAGGESHHYEAGLKRI